MMHGHQTPNRKRSVLPHAHDSIASQSLISYDGELSISDCTVQGFERSSQTKQMLAPRSECIASDLVQDYGVFFGFTAICGLSM